MRREFVPENVEINLPLDICEKCKKSILEIEMLYHIMEIYDGEFEKYEITCRFAKGCEYAYKKGVKIGEQPDSKS